MKISDIYAGPVTVVNKSAVACDHYTGHNARCVANWVANYDPPKVASDGDQWQPGAPTPAQPEVAL